MSRQEKIEIVEICQDHLKIVELKIGTTLPDKSRFS